MARDASDQICLSPLSTLKSGTETVSKGGSLWLIFFRHFFVQRQRNGTAANRERAKQCERPATQIANYTLRPSIPIYCKRKKEPLQRTAPEFFD